MSLAVWSEHDGAAAPIVEGILRLEEVRSYRVRAPSAAGEARAWLGLRELPWDEGTRTFSFEVGHWVGSNELRVAHGDQETRLPLEVTPRANKLSAEAWLALVTELEEWTAGLTVGVEGGGGGAVTAAGAPAGVLAVALLPLVPALIRAVQVIVAAPRELSTSTREEVPLRAVRRASRETLCWLARHPATARAVDPWLAARTGFSDPWLPQQVGHETLDHPVNRYVAWLVRSVARVLRDLAPALESAAGSKRALPDTPAWCQARAAAARSGAEALEATLRRTFLGKLSPMPATEAALLALHDDPIYARAHALARPFLSPRFHLDRSAEGTEAPVRPSFELYELWTFLAVKWALAASLPGWTWTWKGAPARELLAGFGHGARFTGQKDGAELRVEYNARFPGFLKKKADARRWSVSGERRPDLVVSLQRPGGPAAWVCLDAKYRVSDVALAEAFESLHVYRDSLRWEAFGGACRGGLLLAPAEVTPCEPWFAAEFRERYGIGAWRLTPGDAVDPRLGEVIRSWVETGP